MTEIRGVCPGKFGAADPDARMAVAFVMNQMLDPGQDDYRGLGIVMAAYDGLP